MLIVFIFSEIFSNRIFLAEKQKYYYYRYIYSGYEKPAHIYSAIIPERCERQNSTFASFKNQQRVNGFTKHFHFELEDAYDKGNDLKVVK